MEQVDTSILLRFTADDAARDVAALTGTRPAIYL
jgi:hypothetical protein